MASFSSMRRQLITIVRAARFRLLTGSLFFFGVLPVAYSELGAAQRWAADGVRSSYIQYVANSPITPASNSHEIIITANIPHPRAFDMPRSESSILFGSTTCAGGRSILLGSTSCVGGRSTDAFEVRNDPSWPVPMVEEAISFLGLAIGAGGAFLCLGLGRRCFFIAYSCTLTITVRRADRQKAFGVMRACLRALGSLGAGSAYAHVCLNEEFR